MKPKPNKLSVTKAESSIEETEEQFEHRMASLQHRIDFVSAKIADVENRVCEEPNIGTMYNLYQECTKHHNVWNWLTAIKQTRIADAQMRKQMSVPKLKSEDAARIVGEDGSPLKAV